MLVAICMLRCVAAQGDVLFARLRVCMVSFPMAVCPSVCLNDFYLFAWARICLCDSVAVYRYAQPMCLCYCACKSLCLCFFRPFRLCACTPVHRCWCAYSLLCLWAGVPAALVRPLRSSGGKLACAFVSVNINTLACLYDCVLVRRCLSSVPACLNGRKLVCVCAGACACACVRLNAY